ncbi:MULTISPECIES: hypothetical protein [Mesoplasma]|uniref:Uncharacterized protein n=1 Tax=Mesoplasma florum TaxID=2151 RepID=A0A2R3P792_MESFO|nr:MULTISPECIES: hypothetical protein [Mesoplasma]AVN64357.1 hypothetical protein CG003_01600 [Mesoplasma florum]
MKKLLSIMSILFVGTTGSIYPLIVQNQVEKQNSIKQINILKLSNVRENLEDQLKDKTFSSSSEVIDIIAKNSIDGLQYKASLNNTQTNHKQNYEVFNVEITITDENKFKWDNNKSNTILLTVTAFIDSRQIIDHDAIQKSLDENFSFKTYNSSFDSKFELLTNNEIQEGVNIIYINPEEKIINPNNKKLYQIDYQVNVDLDSTKKWAENDNGTNFSVSSYIDERNYIDFSEIQKQINDVVENNYFLSTQAVKEAVNEININSAVEIKNLTEVFPDNKIATKEVEFSYDLVLKDSENSKWKDGTINNIPNTFKAKVENRKILDYEAVQTAISNTLKDNTYTSVEEAEKTIRNVQIPSEISISKIESSTSTIFGSVEFVIELKINDTENNKWKDETVTNKKISVSANIDGRKQIDFETASSQINQTVAGKIFKSMTNAEAAIAEANLEEGIEISSIIPKSTTIYGNVEYTVEIKIDDKLFKWSDGTTEDKALEVLAEIDGRTIVKFESVQTLINKANDNKTFKSVDEAINTIEELKMPKEVIISSVTSSSEVKVGTAEIEIVIDLKDASLSKWSDETVTAKTMKINSKIDSRIKLSTDLITKELGYFAFKQETNEIDILNQMLKLNASLKIEELSVSNITNSSATIKVKEGSYEYFSETTTVNFERDVRIDIKEHVKVKDLGTFNTTKNNLNATIKDKIKSLNKDINMSEIEQISSNIVIETGPSKVVWKVKDNSKVYFDQSTIEFTFTIKRQALKDPNTSYTRAKLYIEYMRDPDLAKSQLKAFYRNYEWDDIEMVQFTETSYSSENMRTEGYWSIKAKSDSYYYTGQAIVYVYSSQ